MLKSFLTSKIRFYTRMGLGGFSRNFIFFGQSLIPVAFPLIPILFIYKYSTCARFPLLTILCFLHVQCMWSIFLPFQFPEVTYCMCVYPVHVFFSGTCVLIFVSHLWMDPGYCTCKDLTPQKFQTLETWRGIAITSHPIFKVPWIGFWCVVTKPEPDLARCQPRHIVESHAHPCSNRG